MPLSEAKIAAYKLMDQAVEAITEAYDEGCETPSGIRTGWLLLVGGVALAEEDEDSDDDQEMRACLGVFEQRGQNPHLSLGIVTDYLQLAQNAD